MKYFKFIFALLLCGWSAINHATAAPNVEIAIHYDYLKPGETMVLYYSPKHTISERFLRDYTPIKLPYQKDGWYRYRFEVEESSSIAVIRDASEDIDSARESPDNTTLLQGYFVREKDQLTVRIEKTGPYNVYDYMGNLRYKFSGSGSLKYRLISQVDSVKRASKDTFNILTDGEHFNPGNYYRARLRSALALINDQGGQLSVSDRQQLSGIQQCVEGQKEVEWVNSSIRRLRKNGKTDEAIRLAHEYRTFLSSESIGIPEALLLKLPAYYPYLSAHTTFQCYLEGNREVADSLYYQIKKSQTGKKRDLLIAYFVQEKSKVFKDFNAIYKDAMEIITDPDAITMIKELKYRLSGAAPYDFALPDSSGKIVRLSDFKGKTVLVDFWFTGCLICRNFYLKELKTVQQRYANDPTIVFIMISIDKDRNRWLNSVRSDEYSSMDFVNLYTGGQGASHDAIRAYQINGYPQPMIVDKKQRIYSLNVETLRKGHNLIRILEEIR